jgi:Flp pilus assembly protein TadD
MRSQTVIRFALLAWAVLAFSPIAAAEQVEVAPGISVARKSYPVPANEAPFFNFAEKTPRQKEVDDQLVTETLRLVPDRAKAAQYAVGAGWQAFLSKRDYPTAAKRFNQAFLLDPRLSGIYHGFAAVVAARFRDFDYADELFRIARRMDSPSPALSADHGRMLLMAGRPREARPLLERGVAENPDWAVPKTNLALAVLQLGDAAEACRLATQVSGRDLALVARDLAYVRH